MARWKLATGHYLNTVVPVEWEYNETARKTGKLIRKRFQVPRFLDPLDPLDWTRQWGPKDNEEGEIIVCYEGKGDHTDIEFLGDPTPDMIPIDDEAKEISATFADRWSYNPAEEFQPSHSQSLIEAFEDKMSNIEAKAPEIPGLSDLTAAIGKMAEQNAELIKTLATAKRF